MNSRVFQAINCAGTDNQTATKQYTKHKTINPMTNKLTLVKKKTPKLLHTKSEAKPTGPVVHL